MTLSQLTYFVEVCNCRNMTKAAAKLHISQPAISKAIQDLENEYGVRLLLRRKAGEYLTYEGKVLYEYAVKLLSQEQALSTAMQQVKNKRDAIRVGTSVLFAQLFPGLLKAFTAKNTELELKNYTFGSIELQRYINNGSLDVAISGMQADSSFHCRTLLNTESHLWMHHANPLSGKKVIRSSHDLSGVPIGLFRESIPKPSDLTLANHYPLEISAEANVVCCTNQLEDICQKLRANSFVTFLPKHALDQYPELISIPLDPPVCFSFAVYWKDEYIHSTIFDFLNFSEHYIASVKNALPCAGTPAGS